MTKRKMMWPLGKGAGVCIHDNALDPKLCADIIQFFEDRPHFQFPGMTFGGVMPDTKLSADSYIMANNENARTEEESETLARFETAVYEQYRPVLAEYIAQYGTLLREWTNREDTGYQYQRYTKETGFYKSHIDGAPYVGKGGDRRVLASVMYLNTVKKGGGTHFDYFDYTCDAVVGRILTFPATFLHLHGGKIPRSSDKSIISTFVYSPEPPVDLPPASQPTPDIIPIASELVDPEGA